RAYDASKALINSSVTETRVVLADHNWVRRVSPWATLPAGTAYVSIILGIANGADAPLICYFDDISIEVQSTTDEVALATNGVTLDVNGYLTGYKQSNDGSTGSFQIRADRFSIVNPAGGA